MKSPKKQQFTIEYPLYEDMLKRCHNKYDWFTKEKYEEFCKSFDITSFIDFNEFEGEIFDWIIHNNKYPKDTRFAYR